MSVGVRPNSGGGPALIDQNWLLGLAGGANLETVSGLTAHAGGTKAAALQIAAGVAVASFTTVASANDSALLPAALKGAYIAVANKGAQTLTVYGKGTDTINLSTTATGYDIATAKNALFFCPVDGAWVAILSA